MKTQQIDAALAQLENAIDTIIDIDMTPLEEPLFGTALLHIRKAMIQLKGARKLAEGKAF